MNLLSILQNICKYQSCTHAYENISLHISKIIIAVLYKFCNEVISQDDNGASPIKPL